ncbi:MAG: sigma-70 family RNA polymerase sigma factor [Pseudomonadota bacterium]
MAGAGPEDEPGAPSEDASGPALATAGASVRALNNEAALLARLQRGETRALALLMQWHTHAVAQVALRLLADAGEAEDVAQETFVRLWQRAPELTFDERGARPWLRRVATNVCLDRLRRRREVTLDEKAAATREPVQAPDQMRAVAQGELSRRIEVALFALPERQRQALVLFHFEGFAQRDVAEALGVSEHAAESLLARAKRKLKQVLAEDWRQFLPEEAPVQAGAQGPQGGAPRGESEGS